MPDAIEIITQCIATVGGAERESFNGLCVWHKLPPRDVAAILTSLNMARDLVREARRGPRIDLYEYGAWTAIYVDGRLAYFNDTPSLSRFCGLIGLSGTRDVLPDAYAENLPAQLKDLHKLLAERNRKGKLQKLQDLRKQVRELEKELEGK